MHAQKVSCFTLHSGWPAQEGGTDAVRVLGDGCAHLHLRAPLPMRGVRILPLELHEGEHVWPEELR